MFFRVGFINPNSTVERFYTNKSLGLGGGGVDEFVD